MIINSLLQDALIVIEMDKVIGGHCILCQDKLYHQRRIPEQPISRKLMHKATEIKSLQCSFLHCDSLTTASIIRKNW